MIHDEDCLFSVGVDQEEGLHVLDCPQGCLLPDTDLSALLTLSLDCTLDKALCFSISTAPSALLHGVCSGLGVGPQERDMTSALSGGLVGDHGVSSPIASALRATPSVLSGPGCCLHHGEVRP